MTMRPCERRNGAAPQAGADGLPALLSPGAEACFIVDAQSAALEAANAAARALFALDAGAGLPVALDSAMPAIKRLRQIAAGSEATETTRLVLWCKGRVVPFMAAVRRVTAPDGRTLLSVTAHAPANAQVAGNGADTAIASDSSTAGLQTAATAIPVQMDSSGEDASAAPASEPAQPPAEQTPETLVAAAVADEAQAAPVKRTDSETLREIARRIREGHMGASRDGRSSEGPNIDAGGDTDAASAARSAEPQHRAAAPDARTLSKVAHELKTPLSAIVAAAEIMRDERLGSMGNDRYLGYASDIHDSARHALDVINAMLTGTSHEVRRIETIDLNDLAATAVSAMQPLAATRAITLELDSEESRLDVRGDATALRQIIFNLVSNSLKFTPKGGDVRVVTGYLANGSAFFVVRDTGEGMSEEEIARAFYGEEIAARPRRGGGYGIGLPMVRHLAEQMGASIDVDSAPGRGTVVLIAFPSGARL